MPRTQDSFVQTWIRGVAEVAHHERWTHWHALQPLGIGVGISLAEADHIARTVQKPDVLAYADEVHHTIAAWLEALDESELDRLLDTRQRLSAFPEYQTTGFVEEVTSLYDQPIWSLLMRPCMGHIHRHLGELEVVKAIVRAPA